MAGKARPVYPPPADFGKREIPVASGKPFALYRLFPGGFDPIYYSRSDENRYSGSKSPCGALYGGADLETCLMETYGDRIYGFRQGNEQVMLPDADWRTRRAALLSIPPVKLCDFTQRKTLQACGVDAASLMSPDLAVPQAWGTAVMDHPSRFDGIRFTSRFTHGVCVALFDRVTGVKVSRDLGPIAKLPEGDRILDRFKVALV